VLACVLHILMCVFFSNKFCPWVESSPLRLRWLQPQCRFPLVYILGFKAWSTTVIWQYERSGQTASILPIHTLVEKVVHVGSFICPAFSNLLNSSLLSAFADWNPAINYARKVDSTRGTSVELMRFVVEPIEDVNVNFALPTQHGLVKWLLQ